MPRGVPGPVKQRTRNPPSTAFKKGCKPGPGRPKGVRNKFTEELKYVILDAFHNAHPEGLYGFLRDAGAETPTAAFALLGRLLPLSTEGKVDATITVIYRDETST
jgi:hypothetical protein